MALEIKILDYGDIELESSFLVLGRDCGRTRRVPTLGFLVLKETVRPLTLVGAAIIVAGVLLTLPTVQERLERFL